MRSILGFILAALCALAFSAAYYEYVEADGQWPASQWLFLVALPYTIAMVRLVGSVDFSGDAPASVAEAAATCCAVVYIAGALAEAIIRAAFRQLRRLTNRA